MENLSHMIPMVTNPKLPPDHLLNEGRAPTPSAKPIGIRTSLKNLPQPLTLIPAKKGRSSWMSSLIKPPKTPLPVASKPMINTPKSHPEKTSDLLWALPLKIPKHTLCPLQEPKIPLLFTSGNQIQKLLDVPWAPVVWFHQPFSLNIPLKYDMINGYCQKLCRIIFLVRFNHPLNERR
jgi:hypothetical protein